MEQVIAKQEQQERAVEHTSEPIVELPGEALERIGGGIAAFLL